MLDSNYHMTLKLLKNHDFQCENARFCHLLHSVKIDVSHNDTKSVIYRFYCMALYQSQMRRHAIKRVNTYCMGDQ